MAKRISKVFQIAKQEEKAESWGTKATTLETKMIEFAASKISKTRAQQINREVWRKVRAPATFTENPLTKHELWRYRTLIQQHPESNYYNTLATAEYRMSNFDKAIAASLKSIELRSEKGGQSNNASIGDFAVLAMSHFKLYETEKAKEYRSRIDEAMKFDIYKNDEECLSFRKEVDDLFKSKSN